jgi:nucleoside-diphosphate-sugar epimerase
MADVGRGRQRVRMLIAPNEDAAELVALGAEAIKGDIRDPQAARAVMKDAEHATIVHLAGVIHPRRTEEFTAVNVGGTRNIVEAACAARARRVLVMSSNSPVGASRNPVEIFDEDSPCRPYMGYGRSKRAMEEWLRAHWNAYTTEIVIIRAPWFYGPEQPARQTRFFSMVKEGRFPLMGRGENRRSMAYVDSLAYGILLAAQAPIAARRMYWIADERPYPMREIIDTVRAVLRDDFNMRVKPTTIRMPGFVADAARIADSALQSIGRYNQEIHVLSEMNLTIACTVNRAKRELGYKPLVSLREGMRRSVSWLLEHGGKI